MRLGRAQPNRHCKLSSARSYYRKRFVIQVADGHGSARPARKKKPVLIEVPAIVRKGAAKPETTPAPANDDRKPAIVTATRRGRRPKPEAEIDPAADARVKKFLGRMVRSAGD